MSDLTPKRIQAPLVWDDVILDLQDLLRAHEPPVYLVGGAVRDAYLRRPMKDVDLVTGGSGLALGRTIANRLGGAFYPLDSERDVGRAILDTPDGRLVLDAARFRGGDLRSDLVDRDFTINALAVEMAGDLDVVLDVVGGVDDLANKILRRCSPQSLANDPVRALRAVRQSVQFGFRIEAATLADVRGVGARLLDVSIERVRDEYFKLLALPRAALALRVLASIGLLHVLLPELDSLPPEQWQQMLAAVERWSDIYLTISPQRTDETAAQFSLGTMVVALDRFRGSLQAHTGAVWADERQHRALMTLALLLSPFGAETAEAYAVRLHLSNDERARLATVARSLDSFGALGDLNPTAIYRFWKRTRAAGVDVILLGLAKYLGEAGVRLNQTEWLKQVERAQILLDAYFDQREQLVDPPTLVNGSDLMRALGISAGRHVGDLLEQIREAQVNGLVTTAGDALDFARLHVNDHPSKL